MHVYFLGGGEDKPMVFRLWPIFVPKKEAPYQDASRKVYVNFFLLLKKSNGLYFLTAHYLQHI